MNEQLLILLSVIGARIVADTFLLMDLKRVGKIMDARNNLMAIKESRKKAKKNRRKILEPTE